MRTDGLFTETEKSNTHTLPRSTVQTWRSTASESGGNRLRTSQRGLWPVELVVWQEWDSVCMNSQEKMGMVGILVLVLYTVSQAWLL